MKSNSNFFNINRFAQFSWFLVAYNILVIVWGALVRASKSGDGCGSHWPLCNGETIPVAATAKTLIEFSHRVTTGLDGILVVGLAAWAIVYFKNNKPIFYSALLSLFFVLTEGAIGAFLVKFELVADNISLNRAILMSFHLVNTLILLFFLTANSWFASSFNTLKIDIGRSILFGTSFLLVIIVGMSGAVSALGNTLFPGHKMSEALAQPEVSSLLKAFVWLQLAHPFLSILMSVYIIALAQRWRSALNNQTTKLFANWTLAFVALQMFFGTLNLIFSAPIWMQLVHLFLALLLWVGLILLALSVLSEPNKAEATIENLAIQTA